MLTCWVDQVVGCQTLEGGVDLAKALSPEEPDRLLDGLPDLVSGLVVVDGEDAENDEGCLTAFHISKRYIF